MNIAVGIHFNAAVYGRWEVKALSDLGNSLHILSEMSLWSDDNIISVIDELISMNFRISCAVSIECFSET